MLSIIACISKANRAIGYQNRLLYHIQSDMTRFRELTTGHVIIMGRKTYESLPNGALPHRRNIVVSRSRTSSPLLPSRRPRPLRLPASLTMRSFP